MRFPSPLLVLPLCAAPALVSDAGAATAKATTKVPTAKRLPSPARAANSADSLPALGGWTYALAEDKTEDAWTWTSKVSAATANWEVRVLFDRLDEKNFDFVQVSTAHGQATARFYRVKAGVVDRQGDPPAVFDAGKDGSLSVQRTASRVRLLWNGRAVTGAAPATSGATFATAARGASFSAPRMQPLEAVLMRDDFMRAQGPDEPETSGGWTRVAGTWKTSNMLGPRANMEQNPNPFVYRGQDDGKTGAFAATGSWFWNDYTVAAAVHPNLENLAAPLVAGLLAYRQADGSGIRGEVDFRKGIARIVDGDRVLAQSAPFETEPNQWHRLYFEPGPGVVRLVVDGAERVRTSTSGIAPLAQGQAALYALSGANSVDFDDVRIGSNPSLSDDFSVPSVGRWADLAGEWQTRPRAAGAPARRVKVSSGAALTVTGSDERSEGTVEAHFAASGAAKNASVGVAFAVRDARNLYLARRVPAGKAAALQIVSVEKGVEHLLASAPNPGPGEIEVTWHDGDISATAGTARAVAAVSDVPPGRVGAWAGSSPGGAATLLSFRALGAPPSFGEEKYPDIFAKDRLMMNWASAASLWQPAGEGASAPRWHVGDFFNDSAVTLTLPQPRAGASIDVSLGAQANDPATGAKLSLTSDGTTWNAGLREGATVIGATKIDAPANAVLRVARRPVSNNDVSLRFAVAGKAVLAGTAPRAGNGTRVAIATAVQGFDWNTASAETGNVLDYGFTGAPVDWRSTKGLWTVAGRWTCQPQWGFFGGVNDVNPTLWSRFSMRGDWTLEAYLATPMDSTRGERSPTDLNISIGDGRDIASGYSFLLGGAQRQRNRIVRGDIVVQDAPYFEAKGKGNTHQDWFLVRLERRMTPKGLRFVYSVNGQPVWDYTDPKPLESATAVAPHLAFWTYNGGLSIARVRLWHAGIETGNSLQSGPREAAGTAAPATAFGTMQSRHDGLRESALLIAQPEKTARIVNPESGGDWTVHISRTAFDAKDKPVLSWRYRVGPGVLVNLYALVDGHWREIGWTGSTEKLPLRAADAQGESNDGSTDPMRIGAVADVKTDSAWHTARFELRKALETAGLPLQVEGLAFAAPDRDYLRAGLGGNHLGASYEIADFKSEATKLAAN